MSTKPDKRILTRKLWMSVFLFLVLLTHAQNFGGVYKIDNLLRRISNPDTLYVVNFWATWCKPCIEELPSFDSLQTSKNSLPVKVLLVNLDFKEELTKKVKPFLNKHKIQAECVLLDEVNGNDFINKIYPEWSGAIPATLFKRDNQTAFIEKKLKLTGLLGFIETFK